MALVVVRVCMRQHVALVVARVCMRQHVALVVMRVCTRQHVAWVVVRACMRQHVTPAGGRVCGRQHVAQRDARVGRRDGSTWVPYGGGPERCQTCGLRTRRSGVQNESAGDEQMWGWVVIVQWEWGEAGAPIALPARTQHQCVEFRLRWRALCVRTGSRDGPPHRVAREYVQHVRPRLVLDAPPYLLLVA